MTVVFLSSAFSVIINMYMSSYDNKELILNLYRAAIPWNLDEHGSTLRAWAVQQARLNQQELWLQVRPVVTRFTTAIRYFVPKDDHGPHSCDERMK